MKIPASRLIIFGFLLLGAVVFVPARVHAQGCGDFNPDPLFNPGIEFISNPDPANTDFSIADGNDGASGDNFSGMDQNTIAFLDSGGSAAGGVMEEEGFPGDEDGGSAPAPSDTVNVTISAQTTVYDQSPTNISSSARTGFTGLSLHSIEYINTDGSSGGVWTADVAGCSGGTSDDRTAGVTFPSPGVYYVRSGASTDGGNTWAYSDLVTVYVNDCMTHPTVTIQMLPQPGMEKWYTASNRVSKQFTVKYTNAQ